MNSFIIKLFKGKVIQNVVWLYFGEFISKGIMLCVSVIAARYLGVEYFGQFSFVFATMTIASIFLDFGFNKVVIRDIAKDYSKVRCFLNNILTIKLLSFFLIYLFVFAIFFIYNANITVIKLFSYAGLWVLFQNFVLFFQAVFRAKEKMQYETITKGIYSLCLIILVIFVSKFDLGLPHFVLSFVLAAWVALLGCCYFIVKKVTNFKLGFNIYFWKSLFLKAWPFAMSGIAAILYSKVDTVMLKLMTTDYQVGIYNAAYTLVGTMIVAITILVSAFFPKISKDSLQGRMHLKTNISNFYLLLSCSVFPLSIVLFVFRAFLLRNIFGAEFVNATGVMALLILSYLIMAYFTLFGNILYAYNLQKFTLVSTLVACVINIILNFFWIPLYGYYGAAISTCIAEVISGVLTFFFYRQKIENNTLLLKEGMI